MTVGYRNPFLANSQNPIAHGRCDQQDCTPIAGALPAGGPQVGEVLDTGESESCGCSSSKRSGSGLGLLGLLGLQGLVGLVGLTGPGRRGEGLRTAAGCR